MNEQWIVGIIMLLQLTVVPWVVKKMGVEKVQKLIPTVNFAISVLTQIVAAFESATAPVAPAVAVVQAGFFASFGNTFLEVFINALVQTAIPTGLHSGVKNTKQYMAKK